MNEPEPVGRLRALLDTAGVEYTIHVHEHNVDSALDGVSSGFGRLDEMAPTLILKTGNGYLAAIIGGDRRIAYKQVKKKLGLKNVSLAGPDEVKQVTGADIGSVSLLNPGLATIIDEQLAAKPVVYGGCGAPGYSLAISGAALVTSTGAHVFEFTIPKGEDGIN